MNQLSVCKRMLSALKRGVRIIFILCIAFGLACPPPARAVAPALPGAQVSGCTTSVGANITSSVTWDVGGSPYCLTTTITVAAGATLTVNPGVTVRGLLTSALVVEGTLNAPGIAAQPITFTSALNSAAGEWVGLVFDGNNGEGHGNLTYTTIRYAGAPYWSHNHAVGLWLGAQVTMNRVQVLDSLGNGVEMTDDASHLAFYNNTVQNSGAYPLVVSADAAGLASANAFSGNHPDRVLINAGVSLGMQSSGTWRNNNGSGVYEIAREMTVAYGATLTVDQGVTVMGGAGVALYVLGGLVANGTALKPVTFTSALDSGPAQWMGLKFSGGTGTLNYTVIRYTGLAYFGENSALALSAGANVTVTNSQILDSFGYGVQVSGDTSALTFHHNTVSGCGYAPLWIMPHNLAAVHDNTFNNNGTDQIRTGDDPLQMEFAARLSNTNQLEAYEFGGDVLIGGQGHLTVDPGVKVLVKKGSTFSIAGNLETLGTASQRVTFSSAEPAPVAGDWVGLRFEGTQERHALGALHYTTVEYAGAESWGKRANIYLNNADARIDHGIIRSSQLDGVYADDGSAASSIEYSDIISNPGYGVFLAPEYDVFVAANNWWGSAKGPRTTSNCNPNGTGSLISDNVVYGPYTTTQGVDPDPLAPRVISYASIRPNRWYVPADGSSQAWLEIKVWDGSGNPLAQRMVHISTSLGDLTATVLTTNAQGQAFTYLTSSVAGAASITVRPGGAVGTCSVNFETATTQVNFTDTGESGLTPDEQSPYMNDNIDFTPLPLIQGVPTKIQIRLTNPYNHPITINGTVGYLQFGIGTALGPIKEVTGWVLPANQESLLEVAWTPPISGHFCIDFHYWYQVDQASPGMQAPVTVNGEARDNNNIEPAPLMGKKPKDITKKAKKSIDMIGDGQFTLNLIKDSKNIPSSFIQDQMFGNILDFNFDMWGGASCALMGGEECGGWKGPRLKLPGEGYGSLGKDPPSQEYTQIAPADPITFTPLKASATMPAARANALNNLMTASLKFTVNLMAAVASNDRYGGAVEANDLTWSSQQASAFIYYRDQSALAAIELADKIDALLAEVDSEGATALYISPADYRAYQARLSSTGFTATEREAARVAGLDDATVEKIRLRRIANNADLVSGDMRARLTTISASLREFGDALLSPVFSEVAGGSPELSAMGMAGESLALVQPVTTTFQVANPTNQTAVMTLKVIPIDIPADWSVSSDTQSLTLQPNQQATVTITTLPGSVALQGTQPRVAVEGYINGQLIGGIVQDIIIPEQVRFTIPPYNVFLPRISKAQ